MNAIGSRGDGTIQTCCRVPFARQLANAPLYPRDKTMQAGRWLAIDRGATITVATEEFPVPPAEFPLAERIAERDLIGLFRLRQQLPASREQENGPLVCGSERAGAAGC